MTITVLINGVTVGAVAAVKSNTSETALQAGTTVFGLSALLVNGAKAGNRNKTCKVYAAVAPYAADFTATTAPDALRYVAQPLEVVPNEKPGGSAIANLGPIPAIGDTLWVWLEEPLLDASATLTVKLVEL